VWSVDANLSISDIQTLGYLYTKSMARTSFTLVMLGIAGAAGLLLGIVGLYSVIAYSVAQRRKEIGIRMALGAQRDALVRMFVREGLILTMIGLTCGLAAAVGLTRLMASLLFHVSPSDPATYCAVSICLMITAVLASYLPARRASNVDPVETLRAE
jgi:putative ABC transport system permease protein